MQVDLGICSSADLSSRYRRKNTLEGHVKKNHPELDAQIKLEREQDGQNQGSSSQVKLEQSQSMSGNDDVGGQAPSYQLNSGTLSSSPSRVGDEDPRYVPASTGIDDSSARLHLQRSTQNSSSSRPGLPQIDTSVPANSLAPHTGFSNLSTDLKTLNSANTPGINSPFGPGNFHHAYGANLLGQRFMSNEHRNSYPRVGMEYMTSQPVSIQMSPDVRCHSHDGTPATPSYNARSRPSLTAQHHSFASIPGAPDYALQNQFSDEGIGAGELNVADLHQTSHQQQLHEQMMQEQQQQQNQAPEPPPEIQAISDDYDFPHGNFHPPMNMGVIMPQGPLQYQPTLNIGGLDEYKEDEVANFDGQPLPEAYFTL